MTYKLTLFASTADHLAQLTRQLPSADESVGVSSALGRADDLALEIERARPDLVVAELPQLAEPELRRIEAALNASPSTSVIMLSPERSPEYLLQVMRSGVREVVPLPLANGELTRAYERQLERLTARRDTARKGRVLAFLPAKGGSGSTFLSTNMAYALSQRGKRVGLIDLNLHFGDAALFLSEERSETTIAELVRDLSRVDPTFLESSMMEVAPNLRVLPAPDTPEGAMDVTPAAVEQILNAARERFDFVLLDMGRLLDGAAVRALDQAEALYLTVQLTLPFIHDARRLLTLLTSLGYARDKLHIIVNRWEKGGEITSSDIQTALGVPVDLEVPNSFAAVAHSINHGIPILKSAPRDPVSKALQLLADRLAPQAVARRRGWFGLSL